MGLDMFLYAKHPINSSVADQVKDLIPVMENMDVVSVTGEAMYWRKANAIHHWFVENVQDGVDDCREAYVSKQKLRELVQTIEDVLDDPDTAHKLLPKTSGFFFGHREYDKEYFTTLEMTKRRLNYLLEFVSDKCHFFYQSSW